MRRKGFITAILGLAVGIFLLFQSEELSMGIRRGLSLCTTLVIPSLFPFMALSVFLTNSRASLFLPQLFRPFTRLLKLPQTAGSLLLSALIGGYPAAAKGIADYVTAGRLDQKTGARMLTFCVNAGPPFLIGAVGVGIFHSRKLGFLLFLAQFLSASLIALLPTFFLTRPTDTPASSRSSVPSNASCLVSAVIEAAESCFRMCAFVLLVCGVVDLLSGVPFLRFFTENPLYNALFTGFFEVTAGVAACGVSGAGLLTAGAITSFSGLCVIFQIAAVTDQSGISLRPFLLSRPVHALFTVGFLRLFLSFSHETVETFSAKGGTMEAVFSASAPAAVSLLCMASLFLLTLIPAETEEKPKNSRRKPKILRFLRRKKQ